VISLEFDRGPLDRSSAGELPLQIFGEFFEIDVRWIEAFDDRDLFSIPSLVDLYIDPLLFFCNFFTDTKFLRQSTRRTNPTIN
jgi:hypothetical protein